MEVLQHYYTSFVNRQAGSAGFQVKAMSRDIPLDTQAMITRLISYRIPPTLDEYTISQHPVALRYFYKSPGEAILLCSQSNGTDENGRPGNFFAHSLVVEPDYFTSMPPILYWRSPFWRNKDSGASSEIAPLPGLEEVETTLDVEGVWHFLAQANRLEQFHKLMSAVVHCNSTQRRIVIIDKADNVAQWIAAVTFMLPPNCRPLLSFATYHHDPYQSPFMITGTTSDSSFRGSSDEYISFFVLNTEVGKISEVAPSPYADVCKKSASSYDAYEAHLLALIDRYLPRFPRLAQIDEQLDLLALYASLLDPHHAPSITADEVRSASAVLTTFEEMRKVTDEDLDELRQLGELLQEASENDGEVEKEYHRVIALQRTHKMSTERSALRELQYITKGITHNVDMESFLLRYRKMREAYGDDIVLATTNSPGYLQWLTKLPENPDAQVDQLIRVWQQLGRSIVPGKESLRFACASLNLMYRFYAERETNKEGRKLLESIAQAMAGREFDWLRLMTNNGANLSQEAFERFYCKLVTGLPLEQRLPYREIVAARSMGEKIEVIELRYDMNNADPQSLQQVLEHWIDHARRQRMSILPQLQEAGFERVHRITQKRNPALLPKLATEILISPILAPLPAQWENYFIGQALSQVSLSSFTQSDVEMCRKYRNREGIPPEIRTVMDGLLAMSDGELNKELAGRLRQRFERLPPAQYQQEAASFIQAFLRLCKTSEVHRMMVNTMFLGWNHMEMFWYPYWETLTGLLVHQPEQAFGLLTFWFATYPEEFSNPYTLHYFFLKLPEKLEAARSVRGFQEGARVIQTLASRQKANWYPLVQDYFFGSKNVIVSVGQGLASQMKRLTSSEEAKAQAEKEQQKRAAYSVRIGTLFEGKRIGLSHKQVSEIYEWSEREIFWSAYWEHFKNTLASKNAEQALEAMSFWFDDSFEVLKRVPFIPVEFFLSLYNGLDEARKDRGFRENARNIFSKVDRQPNDYSWFGLVEPYFAEQGRKFGLFRRS